MKNEWIPIKELPDSNKVVVLIAQFQNGYITDPWTGWKNKDGFERWPHPFPPTHFYELPVFVPTKEKE